MPHCPQSSPDSTYATGADFMGNFAEPPLLYRLKGSVDKSRLLLLLFAVVDSQKSKPMSQV